jgi:regulator of sigma E protease
MFDFFTSVVAVAVVLGIMILVHEWGHFMAAKLFGVRVEVFSFGFGPRLWGRRRGPTDYRVSALPLGGYVKMAGDNPVEERSGAPDEFLSKPRWQRVIIAVAGPTMNIVLAIAISVGLFKIGMYQPVYADQPAVVAGIFKGSPAERAGIRAGDRIAEIDGKKNPTWEDVLFEVTLALPGKPIRVVLDRSGQEIPVTVEAVPALRPRDEFALFGYPKEPVVVGEVHPNSPAERAGLKPQDQILTADGQPVVSLIQFASLIQDSKGKPIDVTANRGGRQLSLHLQPSYGDPGDGLARWQIGITFRSASVYKSHSLPGAVSRATHFHAKLTRQIVDVLGALITGRVSIKQLQGPVGIAQQSGEAARRGPIDFLNLMAVISLNLGILNLLPIPILDGGHILVLAIEGTIRRDLSVAVKERVVQVGLVFLLVIFAIVMYNDVVKLFPNR